LPFPRRPSDSGWWNRTGLLSFVPSPPPSPRLFPGVSFLTPPYVHLWRLSRTLDFLSFFVAFFFFKVSCRIGVRGVASSPLLALHSAPPLRSFLLRNLCPGEFQSFSLRTPEAAAAQFAGRASLPLVWFVSLLLQWVTLSQRFSNRD